MTVYTVHAPPHAAGSEEDVLSFAFVKEGFCWPALFFAPVWLVARGLWLVLLGYILVVVALSLLDRFVPGPYGTVGSVLFGFLFALEANELRRWTLGRRGWRLLGVAVANRRDEAERRFFQDWLDAPRPAPSRAAAPRPAPALPLRPDEGVLGLFPSPGAPA